MLLFFKSSPPFFSRFPSFLLPAVSFHLFTSPLLSCFSSALLSSFLFFLSERSIIASLESSHGWVKPYVTKKSDSVLPMLMDPQLIKQALGACEER